jgi:hypothetical protein
MKQVVDFKNEEQVITFIKIFKNSLFDNNTPGTHLVHKKASFAGFLTMANIFKHFENVIKYLLRSPPPLYSFSSNPC